MQNFLEKFNSTLPNRQAQQVIKILNKRKEAGSIRSLKEFQDQFSQLMEELFQKEMTPSSKLYPATPLAEISVDTYNDMLLRSSNDLESSFEELEKIEQVQLNHQMVVRDLVLKNLRSGMNELKTKINLYRFLNQEHGFDKAIYSTFNEAKAERTSRALDVPNKLFVDPRTKEFISSTYDAVTDPVGEELSLAPSAIKQISIGAVEQVFGGDFKRSIYLVNNLTENDINSLIDSKRGTYWSQKILRETSSEVVKVKLKLTLNGTREVNYLEIEPSLIGSTLENLIYIDTSGDVTTIPVNKQLDKDIKIIFSKISTSTLFLEFRIDNNTYREYENNNTENFNPLEDYVTPAVSSEVLQTPNTQKNSFSCYEYTIGLDNIRIGSTEYSEKSVYVSKPLFMAEESGIVGLLAKERRPYLYQDKVLFDEETFLEERHYACSTEYWVIREELDSDTEESATVLNTQVLPILPMATEKILHERLCLTEIEDGAVDITVKSIGSLMHYPYVENWETNGIASAINLYRNGTLDTGWSWLSDRSTSVPFDNQRMEFYIKVNNVDPSDIFTVSYTPLRGNSYNNAWSEASAISQVDLSGDLTARIGPESVLLFDESQDERVKSYRLYLAMILRQNSTRRETSPFVQSYTLAIGNRNLEKFEAMT